MNEKPQPNPYTRKMIEEGCKHLKMIYVTDLGSNGRVWTAIYAESGQPVPNIGTHRTQKEAETALYEMAEKRGWFCERG